MGLSPAVALPECVQNCVFTETLYFSHFIIKVQLLTQGRSLHLICMYAVILHIPLLHLVVTPFARPSFFSLHLTRMHVDGLKMRLVLYTHLV